MKSRVHVIVGRCDAFIQPLEGDSWQHHGQMKTTVTTLAASLSQKGQRYIMLVLLFGRELDRKCADAKIISHCC